MLAEISTFLDDYPWFILWKWINWSNKNKKNTAKVCHLYFWSNNSALFEYWNWKSSFKHREWYVFARRKGVKIYFFSTYSLNYVKYVLTIWWNINDIPLQYFFIFVASVEPLSKNKSRIIIPKCRVQQLPFFKTVRLYTVLMYMIYRPSINTVPREYGESEHNNRLKVIISKDMLSKWK